MNGRNSTDHPLQQARIIGIFTLSSRVLGMVRDMLCAAVFGRSWGWDAFVLAFTASELLRRLLGEGDLAAAFIPALEKERRANADLPGESRLAAGIFTRLLFGMAVVSILVGVVAWKGPWQGEKQLLAASLAVQFLPYMICLCLMGFFMSLFHGQGSFGLPASSSLVINLFWLGGLYLCRDNLHALVAVVVAGGVSQAAFQYAFLRKFWRARLCWAMTPEEKEVWKRFLPVVLALAGLQICLFLDNVLAEAWIGAAGAVSGLYYGGRLFQLPLGLVGLSTAQASFPLLARRAASGDQAAVGKELDTTLKSVAFLMIPASVALAVASLPVTRLLFGWGHFTPEDCGRTARVVSAFAGGLFPASVLPLLFRGCFSLGNVRLPVLVTLGGVGANLVLGWAGCRLWREEGLALATSISAWLQVAGLRYFMRKEWGFSLAFVLSVWQPLRRSAVMTLGVLAVMWSFPNGLGKPWQAAEVALICLAGLAVYLGWAWRDRDPLLWGWLSRHS